MPEQCLDREKIRTVLIKMCAKGRPESIAGKPVFQVEFFFFLRMSRAFCERMSYRSDRALEWQICIRMEERLISS